MWSGLQRLVRLNIILKDETTISFVVIPDGAFLDRLGIVFSL